MSTHDLKLFLLFCVVFSSVRTLINRVCKIESGKNDSKKFINQEMTVRVRRLRWHRGFWGLGATH